MSMPLTRPRAATPPAVRAAVALARAAFGLIVHGLSQPGAAATIDRLTGKVVPR